MIKSREPALERISVTFQVALTIFCFYLTIWASGTLTIDYLKGNKEHLILAFVLTPIWFGLLELFEMGSMARIQRYREIFQKYVIVVFIGVSSLILLRELFDHKSLSNVLLFRFAILNILVLSLQKVSTRTILKYFRSKGFNTRLILIIADESAISFINQIIATSEWGYKIRGIISSSAKIKKQFQDKFPIYPEHDNYAKIIDEIIIDEVFYCKQKFETSNIEKFIAQSREIGVIFHIHNTVLNFSGLKPNLSYLNHQFLLSFRNTPGSYLALKIKGTIDFFLTILILIIISPIVLIISMIIKLDDGGPVFFKQVRVGRHGRLFKLLKFRTMVVNAEELQKDILQLNEQDGPVFKIKNDPRITKVGRFLRKTSLDELPQFINVLLGDMSIVGPRPPIPSEVKQYKRSINRRLSVNPGITCIWQVSGRNNIPFDQWMEMDMEYIDNWSLLLDFRIILKTFKVLFAGDGQ